MTCINCILWRRCFFMIRLPCSFINIPVRALLASRQVPSRGCHIWITNKNICELLSSILVHYTNLDYYMTIKWIRKEKRVSRVVETKSVLYEPDFDVNVDNDQKSLIAIFPTWCANLVSASSPTLSKVTEIAKCLFFKRSYRRLFSSYLQPPLKCNSDRLWELEKWNCYICQKEVMFLFVFSILFFEVM